MHLRIYEITINGWQIPIPDINGFKRTKNKLWSSNTGRTSSGRMVGDIKAIKYTLEFAWSKLTDTQLQELEAAIGTAAFFPVEFPEEGTGNKLKKNFYAADPTYETKVVVDGKEIYCNFTLQLIEQ